MGNATDIVLYGCCITMAVIMRNEMCLVLPSFVHGKLSTSLNRAPRQKNARALTAASFTVCSSIARARTQEPVCARRRRQRQFILFEGRNRRGGGGGGKGEGEGGVEEVERADRRRRLSPKCVRKLCVAQPGSLPPNHS